MNIKQLPLFYLSPLTIALDDDVAFVDELKHLIESKFAIITFSSVSQFKSYLANYGTPLTTNKLLRNFIESEYNDQDTKSLVEFDFQRLLNLTTTEEIIKPIAVIIVDYFMPDEDGISIFQEISDQSSQKLLLTGSNDYKLGIEMIHNGTIDCFINKDSSSEELLDKIEELTFKYFYKISFPIIKHLESGRNLPISDPLFVKYFMGFMISNKIENYCLIDKYGSMLLNINKNDQSLLIIHDDYSLNEILNILAQDSALNEIHELIRSRKKIPHFSQDLSLLSIEQISNMLYSPITVIGKFSTYYIYHLT